MQYVLGWEWYIGIGIRALTILYIFDEVCLFIFDIKWCLISIILSLSAAAHHHHHHHEGASMKSAHCSSEPKLTENDVSPGIRRRGSRRGQSMHYSHQRKSNAFLDVPDVSSQIPPREEGEDEDSYRLRSFSLTSKGQK